MIYETIETTNGEAEIEASVCDVVSENFKDWCSDFGDPEKLISFVKNKSIEQIAILKSVYVPDKERNKGIGNKLMDLFFNELNDEVDAVILELGEEELPFSLEKWYEGYGFEKVKIEKFEYIMLLVLD